MFGVRLPQSSDCLTSLDFDLVPNKPPPGVQIYDEEIEEIEESEEEEEEDEEDMEPAVIPGSIARPNQPVPTDSAQDAPFPISAIHMPSEADGDTKMGDENGSDIADEDGLFAGDDDSDGMEEVQTTLNEGGDTGMQRQLVETDDYD